MKIKAILIVGLSVLWGYLMASQVGLVKANSLCLPITYPTPITYPITYPTPTPTRSPFPTLTPIPSIRPTPSPKPIPEYSVSGRVSYRFSFWKKNYLVPASDVMIILINQETGKKYVTRTNWSGNYTISVKQGKYKVTPTTLITRWIKFVPPSREIKVFEGNIKGVDFVGNLGGFWSDLQAE